MPDENEGYIKVGVRVRPLDARRGAGSSLKVEPGKASITNGNRPPFFYSHVFEREDNATIFKAIGVPLVSNVLAGYNGTLMAYGQERSS
jgi:hypothetical protein